MSNVGRVGKAIYEARWAGEISPPKYKEDKYLPEAKAAIDAMHLDTLIEALEGVLAYEEKMATYRGFSDCTCIAASRNTERAYEMGECVHQKARTALAATKEN